MPKERYRAYHVERAQGGRRADDDRRARPRSSRDSPPVFNNILAWKDEVVGWMKAARPTPCHEQGCAVMIQLTHLGRRTRWDKGDWLPVVSPATSARPRTGPSRRGSRTGTSPASSRTTPTPPSGCRRPASTASSSRPTATCMDQFWSPLTNDLDAALWRLARQPAALHLRRARRRSAPASATDFIVGVRYTGDEELPGGLTRRDGLEISRRLQGQRPRRLPQRGARPYRHRRRPDRRHPDPGHARARRTSTSPARSAPRPASRPSTPPRSRTSRPPATRSPAASSTWSA